MQHLQCCSDKPLVEKPKGLLDQGKQVLLQLGEGGGGKTETHVCGRRTHASQRNAGTNSILLTACRPNLPSAEVMAGYFSSAARHDTNPC
jgi:hypothetical protein